MYRDLLRLVFSGCLAVLATGGGADAGEMRLVPGLALKEEFNDNISFSPARRNSDFILTATPSLEFSGSSERENISLTSGINWLNYSRYHSLNAVDYYVQGGLGYRASPRATFSGSGGFVRDSRPDRTDQNGLSLQSGSQRQNYQANGTFAVTELSNLTASYAYSQENFDRTGAVSNWVHSVSMAQDYDLERFFRQTKVTGTLGFSRDLTDTSLVDNYTISLGVTSKLSELWSMTLTAGGRHTSSAFDATLLTFVGARTTSVHADDSGWIGRLSFIYSSETGSASVAASHDMTTASGRNGTTERTGLTCSVSERFTRELSTSAGLSYNWNRSKQNQFASQEIDEKQLAISASIRYEFTNDLSLEGTYRYNSTRYSRIAATADQNVFLVMLALRKDLLDL